MTQVRKFEKDKNFIILCQRVILSNLSVRHETSKNKCPEAELTHGVASPPIGNLDIYMNLKSEVIYILNTNDFYSKYISEFEFCTYFFSTELYLSYNILDNNNSESPGDRSPPIGAAVVQCVPGVHKGLHC